MRLMNTFPSCLCNKAVVMPFSIIISCLSTHNRKIDVCSTVCCYSIDCSLPRFISIQKSSRFLVNGTKRMTRKKLFCGHKGTFCKTKPSAQQVTLIFFRHKPSTWALFFSEASFLPLFSQCLVNAIWCLRESHPLPLFSSRIPLADPVLLRKDDKNRAAPAYVFLREADHPLSWGMLVFY